MPAHRKPSAQKRLEGTERPDRGNPFEPEYQVGAPPRPSWLSTAAAAEWDRLVPMLESRRVLAEVDLGVLAAYCQAVGDLEFANKTLKRSKRFYKSGTLWKEHPAAKASRDLSQQVRLLAGELGLSPASRSKASSIPEKEEADPMAVEDLRPSRVPEVPEVKKGRDKKASAPPVN